MKIDHFRGEYGFLSNFWEVPVTYKGLTYGSNEAAFQAQKCMTEEEKMEWALRPVRDNLEVILDSSNKLSKMIPDRRDDSTDKKYQLTTDNLINEQCSYFFDEGYISIEAVAHMRGRSIAGTYVIIDEAQNLTPNQVKTLISRASKDTKIVLMGDPYQIDHPYLDFRTNCLCFVSEKMKGSSLVSQITLSEDECERSELSLEISRRMNH
jgi:PhoH-like ATPase